MASITQSEDINGLNKLRNTISLCTVYKKLILTLKGIPALQVKGWETVLKSIASSVAILIFDRIDCKLKLICANN